MGLRWRAAKVALAAAGLCVVARVSGSVQVEPVARLSLEGGYDSNVLYDGTGGSTMGRVSPDVGLHVRDHTYSLLVTGGGDLVTYPQRNATATTTVWNQRGAMLLDARLTPRLKLDLDAKALYAYDSIGLARAGIFVTGAAPALLVGGKGRVAWRWDRQWTVAGTIEEHVVRFRGGDGAASHTPGVEVARRLDGRLEVGGTYRFNYFQDFSPGARDATAHEALALVRWRGTRRLMLEASGGAALWYGPGNDRWLIPEAAVNLLGHWRQADVRLTVRHGVGLGVDATPGLFDSAEGAVTMSLGRSWVLHADGGLWRSGAPPWGTNAVTGYGVEGEIGYRVTREAVVGIAASRFARLDVAAPQFDRNVIGLRVTWELRHR